METIDDAEGGPVTWVGAHPSRDQCLRSGLSFCLSFDWVVDDRWAFNAHPRSIQP